MKNSRQNKPAGGRSLRPAERATSWPSWPALLVGTLLLYTFALVISTHLPKVSGLVRTPGFDKVLHFVAYFVQAMLAAAAVAATGRLGRRNAAILIVALVAFGGLVRPHHVLAAGMGSLILPRQIDRDDPTWVGGCE